MEKIELEKKVLEARNRRNRRMRINYHLCRGFGYSAVESSIVMNQGWKNIIANAYRDGMYWKHGTIPEEYQDYALRQAVKYQTLQPEDVTEIEHENKPPQDLPKDKAKIREFME